MTTIAANLQMMIADRLVDDDGTKFLTTKIARIKDALVACAGDVSAGTAFKAWYADKRRKVSHVDFSEFEALALTSDGLFYYGHSLVPESVGSFYCIGTGKPYVIGATKAGADIVAAVKIAIDSDMSSGGRVQVMRLHE